MGVALLKAEGISSLLPVSGYEIFKILSTAVFDLDTRNGSKKRKGRVRSSFTENELRNFIKTRALPTTFQYELRVAGDIPCPIQTSQRRIDYVWLKLDAQKPTNLTDVPATCELKGPARPTVWEGNQNWYDKPGKREPKGLKPDICKQRARSKMSPSTEHYVFWVLERPDRSQEVAVALSRLCNRLSQDVPQTRLIEYARQHLSGLWLFYFGVTPE